MVAPERQRQGLGEVLFRTWDRNVGASLGLGLSDASYRLFQKLRWPDVGPVPCLVKPLTRRAFRHPRWPTPINRLVSALTLPIVLIVSRTRPLARRSRLDQALRRQLYGAVGRARAEVRPRRAARRQVSQLEVRHGAARPLHDGGVAARWTHRGIRGLPARAGAARARHAARRHPHRSRRRGRFLDAAALDRPGGASGGLRQDPYIRHARGLPTAASAIGLLPGEVDDGVRGQGEWRRGGTRRSTRTPTGGT